MNTKSEREIDAHIAQREMINHERKREAMNAREGRIYRNMRKKIDALIAKEEGRGK